MIDRMPSLRILRTASTDFLLLIASALAESRHEALRAEVFSLLSDRAASERARPPMAAEP